MEISLLIVIVFLLSFIVYSDIQNRTEREKLQMKLMAKSLTEYKEATEEAPVDATKQEDDPYIELGEAGIDRILGAKENK